MHETAKVPNAQRVSAAFSIPEAAPSAPLAPISLIDGRSSIALRTLSSTTRVTGPLATTEMRLVFSNPERRVREGRFRLALPERSFVTRVAMKVDGVFREADSVALSVARDVYEETLHARRDPLLVEQSENELSARVFPIPAEGEKEIIVGWTSEVTEALPVRIPLRGLGAIEHIDATVTDAGEPIAHVEFHEEAPFEDLIATPRNSLRAIHTGASVVARVRVSLASPSEPIGASLTILVDTSGSHASSFTTELRAVSDVVTELARVEPNAHLTIAAFDQGVEVVHEGAMRSFDEAAMTRLRRHGALGASDLRAALAWAASRGGRALLVGDGLATAGSSERATLLLATRGLARLDVVATGDARDDATLRALTMATPSAGVFVRGDGAAIAARLRKKTERAFPVVMTGTRWMSPRTLAGVQDGDERMVYAELLAPPPDAAARPDPADAWIVERAVAKARIDAMAETAALDGWREADRGEVLALARSFRLASPLTAQIVVETDADRAGLFAHPGSASPPASPPPSPTPSAPVGAHVAKAPTLRMAAVMEVTGRLPAESVRRTVRQHAGTFRGCYAEGLLRNPKLRGRVTTKFRIGRDGLSSDAVDGGSDLGDSRVVECIVHAFDGVQFTPPAGGIITVLYPLSLRPRGKDANENESAEAFSYNITHHRPSSPPGPSAPLSPWTGFYEQARLALAAGAPDQALAIAASARTANASDGLALIALGEAAEAAAQLDLAARAYGSLADQDPHDADELRTAATRLERIGRFDIATELLRRVLADRPDEPSAHQLLAITLVHAGDLSDAFDVLERAAARTYLPRYGTPRSLFSDELAMVGAALVARAPARTSEIETRANAAGAELASRPSTWFVLDWETDASWVDLVVHDGSGAAAVERVTSTSTGFGPVALRARGAKLHAEVSFVEPGSAGDGPGAVHMLEQDAGGTLRVSVFPFVLMTRGASLDLGER